MDQNYKDLVAWLMHPTDKKNLNLNSALVLSKKILADYNRSCRDASGGTNIHIIVGYLVAEGRKTFISNRRIRNFQTKHFSKKILRNLKCNIEDRDHIPAVLLSKRKYALTIDDNLILDLVSFPGFNVRAEKRPERLGYR